MIVESGGTYFQSEFFLSSMSSKALSLAKKNKKNLSLCVKLEQVVPT